MKVCRLGLIAVALAQGVIGCGGAASSGGISSRDELSKQGKAAILDNAFDRGAAQVETWKLGGDLPEIADISPSEPDNPWKKLLAETSTNSNLVLSSRAMECAAQQAAAFVVDRQARPSSSLMRFIAARCGVPTGMFGMAYQTGTIPASTTGRGLFEEWSADVKATIEKFLSGGRGLVGIAAQRNSKRAAVVIVQAQREVDIESVPLVPTEGKVVLKGKLLTQASSIRALVTHGRFGYEACTRDIEVSLPAFALECPVAEDDPTARIELASFLPGRDLGDEVMDLTVFPMGSPPDVWSRPTDSGALLPPGAPAEQAVLEQMNARRKEAGMAELRLSMAQSRSARELTPHFFAASLGLEEPGVGDKVALGMLAGREVEGTVREGHFSSQWVFGKSPSALLDRVLESPFGRETVLDPSVSLVALGLLPDDDVLAAIFSTYALIDTSGRTDHPSEVLGRISKLRTKRRRSPPDIASELDAALTDTVARIEGGMTPKEALDSVTDKSMAVIASGRVRAWFVTTSSVERLEVPKDLLTSQSLRVGVGVAKYRPDGSPWTRLGVLMVAVERSQP